MTWGWYLMPCSFVSCSLNFEGVCRLHLQEQASRRICCIAHRKSILGPSCSEPIGREVLWGEWSYTGPARSNISWVKPFTGPSRSRLSFFWPSSLVSSSSVTSICYQVVLFPLVSHYLLLLTLLHTAFLVSAGLYIWLHPPHILLAHHSYHLIHLFPCNATSSPSNLFCFNYPEDAGSKLLQNNAHKLPVS